MGATEWPTEAVRSFLGRGERPVPARDPVSRTRSRMFAEAVGDANPIYTDDSEARAAGHPGVVAPPALLQAWTMPGLGPGRDEDGPTAELYRLLDGHGLTGLIAVGYEQEYHRYLRPGDQLTEHATISAISDPKDTWLGRGHFISATTEFRDQDGALAGTMTWTVFKYRPESRPPRDPEPPAPDEGDVPTLSVPVSATLIVGGAIGTNDYAPIHHDVRAATAAGFADIFPNILTTCGLAHRYVTGWAGHTARVRRTAFRLGVPCYPGDTLTFTGHTGGTPEPGPTTVRFTARNARGTHAHGTVVVEPRHSDENAPRQEREPRGQTMRPPTGA